MRALAGTVPITLKSNSCKIRLFESASAALVESNRSLESHITDGDMIWLIIAYRDVAEINDSPCSAPWRLTEHTDTRPQKACTVQVMVARTDRVRSLGYSMPFVVMTADSGR